jgi:hypothetical protein
MFRVDDLGRVTTPAADHAERVARVWFDVDELAILKPKLNPASSWTDATDPLLPLDVRLAVGGGSGGGVCARGGELIQCFGQESDVRLAVECNML